MMTLEELNRRLDKPSLREIHEDTALRGWVMQIVTRPLQVTDLMRKCHIDFTTARRAVGNQCEHPGCSQAFPNWLLPDGTSVCGNHVHD